MRKLNSKFLLIVLIELVVFNVIFFVVPFPNKNETHWISYVAVMIALLSQPFFFNLGLENGKPIKSLVYGYPIYKLGVIYLTITTIFAIAFIGINSKIDIPYWIAVVIYIIVIGAVGIGVVKNTTARDIVEDIDSDTKNKQQFKNTLHIKLNALAINFTGESNVKLSELLEEVKFSDPMSSDQLESIEQSILEKVHELEIAYKESKSEANIVGIINQISNLLKQRNELCKHSK